MFWLVFSTSTYRAESISVPCFLSLTLSGAVACLTERLETESFAAHFIKKSNSLNNQVSSKTYFKKYEVRFKRYVDQNSKWLWELFKSKYIIYPSALVKGGTVGEFAPPIIWIFVTS